MTEFSRKVPALQVDRVKRVRHIEANAEERAALAKRFDLVAIDRLEAHVTLRRLGAQDILLEAEMIADATQSCVITLEPVPATLHESFRLIFRPGIDEETADQLALANPDDDLVEPLHDQIDMGEAVAQQLSVALDPFPRSEGAEEVLAGLGVAEAPESDTQQSDTHDN